MIVEWQGLEILTDDLEVNNMDDLQEPICRVKCPKCEYEPWLFPVMQSECIGCGHLWADGLWLDSPGFWDNHPATLG